jgi:hypothetical protein
LEQDFAVGRPRTEGFIHYGTVQDNAKVRSSGKAFKPVPLAGQSLHVVPATKI